MLDQQERWAIFWCSLFSPVLYGEIPQEEVGRFMAELTSCEHLFPDGRRPSAVAGHAVAEVETIPRRRFRRTVA